MSLDIDNPTDETRAILNDIENKRAYCRRLFAYFKSKNAQSGANAAQAAWSHHRFKSLETTIGGLSVTLDFVNLINTGDIELAYLALSGMTVDDGSRPYHWLTAERIDEIKAELALYLGV